MNANGHIDVEDLAMLALLPESAEGASEARAHLAGCARCREEYARVQQDLALYALATPIEPLPVGARERLMQRLEQTAQEPGLDGAAGATARPVLTPVLVERKRSAASIILPWLGWAVAAAALLVAFGLRRESDGLRDALHTQNTETAQLEMKAATADRLLAALRDPAAVRVNLVQPKAPAQPSARASYDARYGTLLMQASNLAPLPADKVYELWVIPANGNGPIPAGVFRPDDRGNAVLLQASLPQGVAAKAFGITVEHAGGSPTPTMPILLAGTPG